MTSGGLVAMYRRFVDKYCFRFQSRVSNGAEDKKAGPKRLAQNMT